MVSLSLKAWLAVIWAIWIQSLVRNIGKFDQLAKSLGSMRSTKSFELIGMQWIYSILLVKNIEMIGVVFLTLSCNQSYTKSIIAWFGL